MPQATDIIYGKEQSDEREFQERFEELFDEYQRPIYYYLLRMIQNPDVAEDLTQETFIRVHKGLSGFRTESALSTWIYRIATNVSLDYLRSKVTHLERSTDSLGEANLYKTWLEDRRTTPTESSAARAEMSECVQRFIQDLPPNYRAPLILSDLQGLKNREIAEVLDIPLSTVKIRLHRARRKLHAALDIGCDLTHDERNVLVCDEKNPSVKGVDDS